MFSVTVERLLLYLFARDPLQRLVCQIWRMSNAMSEESSRERKGLSSSCDSAVPKLILLFSAL